MTGISLFGPENITLGKRVGIGKDTTIDASDGGTISIGNDCLIGPFVLIRAADHKFDDPTVPILMQGHNPGVIIIEDDCWIAGHVTITRNVTIGRGSVIGANSVVTKNIPPYSIAAGNPAVVIKSRFPDTDMQSQ
jgi:galactoside O-acetyltransferase